jgi:hypothetical protein
MKSTVTIKNNKINLKKEFGREIQDGSFDIIIMISDGTYVPISCRIFSKRFIRGFNKRASRKEDKLYNREIVHCLLPNGQAEIIFNSALILENPLERWDDTDLLPSYGTDKWCDEHKW